MGRLYFLLIILLFTISLTAKQDSLFTKIIGDTVQVWNTDVSANCAALFNIQVIFSDSNNIIITECDEKKQLLRCKCNFDLHVSLVGLTDGQYKITVCRQELKEYLYTRDTTILIGDVNFTLENSSFLETAYYFEQSECRTYSEEPAFTSAYWYPEADSAAKAMHSEAELRCVYSNEVNLDGTAEIWFYKFLRYDHVNNRPEYFYFHNNQNQIVFDSVSFIQDCCVMSISEDWFDSDSAIAFAESNGGKTYREKNPDYIITAYLSQALVPYSYPCWSVNYLSRTDSNKKFSLYFDARINSSPLISFFPEVDTLFLLGGCTTPELIFHFGNIGAADNISLEAGFNTSIMVRDSSGVYNPADKSYFLVIHSTGNYDYEIRYFPKSYPPIEPVLIPFDSTFYFGQHNFDIQLLVKLNGTPVDSIKQSFISDFGLNVETRKNVHPEVYALLQNFPNPFNPVTTIKYELPKESEIQLIIYNILGKKVNELVDSVQKPGRYEVNWNAADFASGIYICRIKANNFISSKKIILLK